MPILTRSKPKPTIVLCVREVRAGVPVELLSELRNFYTETLALVPWPRKHQVPGGWGLGNPRCGLLLEFRHDPLVDAVRRRFGVAVHSLAQLEERLLERAWPYHHVHGFGWSDQYIHLHDPAGHLIEARQSQPL